MVGVIGTAQAGMWRGTGGKNRSSATSQTLLSVKWYSSFWRWRPGLPSLPFAAYGGQSAWAIADLHRFNCSPGLGRSGTQEQSLIV